MCQTPCQTSYHQFGCLMCSHLICFHSIVLHQFINKTCLLQSISQDSAMREDREAECANSHSHAIHTYYLAITSEPYAFISDQAIWNCSVPRNWTCRSISSISEGALPLVDSLGQRHEQTNLHHQLPCSHARNGNTPINHRCDYLTNSTLHGQWHNSVRKQCHFNIWRSGQPPASKISIKYSILNRKSQGRTVKT
jgi:hypothetical protein